MCEYHNTFAGVGFFVGCEGFSDSCEIGFGAWVVGCGCPCFGFGFVGDDYVGVGKDFFDAFGEELGDEGSGEVEYEGLIIIVYRG